jgi:hypothetical protein
MGVAAAQGFGEVGMAVLGKVHASITECLSAREHAGS